MTYRVVVTPGARRDLEHRFDFLIERELAFDGGDLGLADEALAVIAAGLKTLQRFPFTCRKAALSRFLREVVFPSTVRATWRCSRVPTATK